MLSTRGQPILQRSEGDWVEQPDRLTHTSASMLWGGGKLGEDRANGSKRFFSLATSPLQIEQIAHVRSEPA